jgi:tRNA nucleotidyltransferase (CCA-adding enzyme)
MLAVLRDCGALDALLPEVAALYGVPQPPAHHPEVDAGVHVALALDWSAARQCSLEARYAILAHDLGKAESPMAALPRHHAHERRSVQLARRLSERLRVPIECRDAAVLAARWHGVVHRAAELRPATLLEVLSAADALRRPGRLDTLLDACAADACSRPGAPQDYPPAALLRQALAVVKAVDAGAIARAAKDRAGQATREDAVAAAVRTARLKALRAMRAQARRS